MFVNKNINKIEDQIWQNFKYDDRIGFLSGLSGIAFFYDTLFDILYLGLLTTSYECDCNSVE